MTKKFMPARKLFFGFRWGLKNKLIFIVIAVGTVPLVLAMIFSYLQGNKSLTEVIGASFQALAYETSTKIDLLLKDEIYKTTHLAHHPTLILSVAEHNKFYDSLQPSEIIETTREQARAWKDHQPLSPSPIDNRTSRVMKDFLLDSRYASENTVGLFITAAQGVLVSSINFHPDFLNNHLLSWKKIQSGELETYIGPLILDNRTEQYIFEIAVPLKNAEGQVIGVLHRIYPAKEFFAQFLDPITFGQTGHVMLINSEGVVLTCPILPTGHQLSDPQLVKAVTGPTAAWVKTQGDGHGSEDTSLIGYSPLEETSHYIMASIGQRWYTYTWQSSDELFSPTKNLLFWVLGASLFSILLIIIMGSLAANKIVQPIRQLQRTAAAIGQGETVPPLDIKTGDEIESLADEINTMSGLLQKTFSGLEHQVETITQEVVYLKKYTDRILMSVPEMILIFDANLKMEYANAAFEQITGCGADDYIGEGLDEAPLEHQDQWLDLLEELKAYRAGIRQDSQKAAPGTASPQAKDPLAPMEGDSLEDSRPTLTLGHRVFVYQFFDVVLEEDKGRRFGLIMKNITEEKKLLDKLTQADKLSGLGTLAAGIAHEMNNPLYSIMGYTEAILDEKNPSTIQTLAQKVLDRSKHMASIILNMSGYTRNNDKDGFKDVNIKEKVEVAVEMAMMACYHDGITLETRYEDVPLIKAKPEEIQQVFLNIIRNAIQAMDGKGTLMLSTHNHNGHIVTEIKDTGPGIAPEYLSKVFDPFFTTKEQGEGTGLGLNIVHRVVEKYGGNIKIDSKPGQGTTFEISLPVNGQGKA